jgi:hypothetical protein
MLVPKQKVREINEESRHLFLYYRSYLRKYFTELIGDLYLIKKMMYIVARIKAIFIEVL